jgi:hypothetical protein
LMQLFDAARIGVDFLKTDDLSAACLDHLGDARGVAAAIGTDALMNIVGQHREALHESELVSEFRPIAMAGTFFVVPESASLQTSGEIHRSRAT